MSIPSSAAATDTRTRALAPDLARGFMLLIIATVHAQLFRFLVTGSDVVDDALTGLDATVTVLMSLLAEHRGYPMFAALFGYGLARAGQKYLADGRTWEWARRLLRVRGRWLVAIGLAHTLLLFFGDIIAVYGIIALIFVGALRLDERSLLRRAAIWLVVGSVLYSVLSVWMAKLDTEETALVAPNAIEDAVVRLAVWPTVALSMILASLFPFLVGVWAARQRLLESPEQHRALLTRVAAIGLPVAVLGGVPSALVNTGVLIAGTGLETGILWVHVVTGYAGGFGYAALITLIALRIGSAPGPVATALAATGQRSMTCYLLQSVAWLTLFAPYLLDLAPAMSTTVAVATGVGVWAVTVILADIMRRTGVRGPAEAFLRSRVSRRIT